MGRDSPENLNDGRRFPDVAALSTVDVEPLKMTRCFLIANELGHGLPR
jgi:hypothetical protein